MYDLSELPTKLDCISSLSERAVRKPVVYLVVILSVVSLVSAMSCMKRLLHHFVTVLTHTHSLTNPFFRLLRVMASVLDPRTTWFR